MTSMNKIKANNKLNTFNPLTSHIYFKISFYYINEFLCKIIIILAKYEEKSKNILYMDLFNQKSSNFLNENKIENENENNILLSEEKDVYDYSQSSCQVYEEPNVDVVPFQRENQKRETVKYLDVKETNNDEEILVIKDNR